MIGLGPGITFGYHCVYESGFTIGCFTGMSYMLIANRHFTNNYVPSAGEQLTADLLRINLRLGFNLGYRFGL